MVIVRLIDKYIIDGLQRPTTQSSLNLKMISPDLMSGLMPDLMLGGNIRYQFLGSTVL